MSTWTTPALEMLEAYLTENRRRAASAGADPDEVLADLRRHIDEEIGALTLLVVTHALDLARRMERVYELRDGRIEPCGSGEMRQEAAE